MYKSGPRDFWVLSRFDDVESALREWQRFSSRVAPGSRQSAELLFSDPPLHDRLRGVIRDRFRAPSVARLEAAALHRAQGLFDEICAGGEADAAAEFAWPLALAVVSEVVGVPGPDRASLLSLLQRRTYPQHFAANESEADGQLSEAFLRLLAERQRTPSDDLLGDIAAAIATGLVTPEEAVRLADFLFEGLDTVANLLCSALQTLLKERPPLSAERDERALRSAVEELIRFDSPIQGVFRMTTKEISLHGRSIPAGSTIYLLLGAANRDERRYPRPDNLDLARPTTRPLAFGSGTHVCPGAPLARLLLRLVLPLLAERVPAMSLIDVVRPGNDFTRAILSLRVET